MVKSLSAAPASRAPARPAPKKSLATKLAGIAASYVLEPHPDTDRRPDWRLLCLLHMERRGSVTHAARRAGVNRSHVYGYARTHPKFAAALGDAVAWYKEGLDVLIGRPSKRGDTRLLLAKARAELPEKYGNK